MENRCRNKQALPYRLLRRLGKSWELQVALIKDTSKKRMLLCSNPRISSGFNLEEHFPSCPLYRRKETGKLWSGYGTNIPWILSLIADRKIYRGTEMDTLWTVALSQYGLSWLEFLPAGNKSKSCRPWRW